MALKLGLRETYKCDIIVAVVGQPNVGKSTLFNVLTGELSHVANWPGVTVETTIGQLEYRGRKMCFVDLPGVYGLSATSTEEVIAREYILGGEPDVILVLVDSTVPERTAYLAVQILELNPKVVIALTKWDLAHSQGVHIHVDQLESILGVPVVPVSAIQGYGLRDLLDKIIAVAEGKAGRRSVIKVDYGPLESAIREIENKLRGGAFGNVPLRWIALRLLEGDEKIEEIIRQSVGENVLREVCSLREAFRKMLGREPIEQIAMARFNYIDSIAKRVVVRTERPEERESVWERFALWAQKPFIGPILSLAFLFLVFLTAFSINTGFPLNVILRVAGREDLASLVEEYSIVGLLERAFGWLSDATREALSGIAPGWLVSLISDGIIPGVGAVLSFFPLIVVVSMLLAMLEDSGLAPRFAASFHNFFSRFGLSGRSVYPMLISLGCNVPGVLAGRAAIEEEERIEIVFSTPFIPCQARLVVLLAFVTAFFGSPIAQALAIISVYLMGIGLFLLISLAFRRLYLGKKEPPEFILEMPPIHRPNAKVVWWITWDWSKHFLKKAGVIIFALSVASWALLSYGPQGVAGDPSESYAFLIGEAISPLLAPFGIRGTVAWVVGFMLFFGFIAKEGLIEAVVMLQGGNLSVSEALRALNLTLPQAFSLLVFMMLYVPCLATVAVVYRESRSLRLTLLQIATMLAVAYLVALITCGILSLFV